jgi:hypothetical protein
VLGFLCSQLNDFNEKLWLAFWGALAGGVVSLILTVVTPLIKRWNLTRKLSIVADPVHSDQTRFRVVNGGYWTVADAILYISLDFKQADVLPVPPGRTADITPTAFVPLDGDQLCWSVRNSNWSNPMKVSILAKERQPFSPCRISAQAIAIPTELGWSAPHSRVLLCPGEYTGRLRLVSADTNGREFHLQITPDMCTITPVRGKFPLVIGRVMSLFR